MNFHNPLFLDYTFNILHLWCFHLSSVFRNIVCICGVFIYCLQYLEILSETKLKPAALGKPAPKTASCLTTPKKSEDATETGSCVHFQNVGIKFQNNIHYVFLF